MDWVKKIQAIKLLQKITYFWLSKDTTPDFSFDIFNFRTVEHWNKFSAKFQN